MPSRADVRHAAEIALRAVLLATLVLALWRSLRQSPSASRVIAARTETLDRDTRRALHSSEVSGVDVELSAPPTAAQRDALVALRRNSISIHWRGEVPGIALEVIRRREPAGGATITVIGAGSAPLVLSDSAGLIDTVRAGAVSVDVGTLVGAVSATRLTTLASARTPKTTPRRAVLVLGQPDWEEKFVQAALGEAGWQVRARVPVAPGVVVRDDGLLPIDTARYDAVVVLDSSASDLSPAITRFVQQGGGLVVSGGALGIPALRALTPAAAGDRRPGRILLASDTVSPSDLPFRPLLVREDAATLERHVAGVALAVRRVGLGRALAVGYDESWRWRMLGGFSGLAEHRDWWSRVIAAVAPERADTSAAGADAAPRAALIDALGPPSGAASETPRVPEDRLPAILLGIVILAELAETASRRFRGVR